MIGPHSTSNAGPRRYLQGRATRLALTSFFSAALITAGTASLVAAQDASEAPLDDVQTLLEGLDFGSGAAAVALGAETYQFGSATESADGNTYLGMCRQFFGVIAAGLRLTDGREITVDMEIPPVDWDTYDDGRYSPPRIEVSIEDPYQTWIADAEWAASNGVEGQSQVDTFERDGISATGTATFLEQLSLFTDPPGEPVQGTFEVRCAAE